MPNGKISEIFRSFDGEHNWYGIGAPSVFVRFFGCTYDCSYCDTKQVGYEEYSVQDVMSEVLEYGVDKLTITGGEPLDQPEFFLELIESLQSKFKFTVETNGKHPRTHIEEDLSFVMDWKMPSSGCFDDKDLLNILTLGYQDFVKFVISNEEDYEIAKSKAEYLTEKQYFKPLQIIFSPVFSSNHNQAKILPENMIRQRLPYRISYQMHKILNIK